MSFFSFLNLDDFTLWWLWDYLWAFQSYLLVLLFSFKFMCLPAWSFENFVWKLILFLKLSGFSNSFCWILLWLRYGLVWITTTLVFVLAALGNCATYLMQKRSDQGAAWSFDVSYMNVAAGSVYGYAIVVPMAFYFSLQYLGSNSSLIRFWCLWGYSLFIFILASVSFWNLYSNFVLFFYPLDTIS